MKRLLKDPGFWIYIGVFALLFATIYNMKPRKECPCKMLPTDRELKQIEGK